DVRVRRAASLQLRRSLQCTAYAGRLRQLDDWAAEALDDADPVVARSAAELFATNRWRSGAAPILKAALADPTLDRRAWNLRLQQLLQRAPTQFSDDELVALVAGQGGPASDWTERLAVETLLKRNAIDSVVRLIEQRQGERAEVLAMVAVTLSLTRRAADGRASDGVLSQLDQSRAGLLTTCLTAYWSDGKDEAIRRVQGWAADPAGPLGLRLAACEVIEADHYWSGEGNELSDTLATALESPDPLVALGGFCTLVSWLEGGYDWHGSERSAVVRKLTESAQDWAWPQIDVPESL
ncbi:MAG TPA: hypothetical protein VGE52_21610, partial [Pirellulales bacterium]